VCDNRGKGGFPSPRWTPKDDRRDRITGDQCMKNRTGSNHIFLANNVIKSSRSQNLCEWTMFFLIRVMGLLPRKKCLHIKFYALPSSVISS